MPNFHDVLCKMRGMGISMKKFLITILIIISFSSLMSCGNTVKDQSTEKKQQGLERYPLSIYVAGEKPVQQDEVCKEISERTRDTLNIDLSINYIPWGDYIDQMRLKSISGEEYDICLNFASQLASSIARKQCIPLNELIDKYGEDLKMQIPQDLWEGVTVDGKIYGVPSVYAMTGMARSILIRKDLREKYHLPEVEDQATLEIYLDTILKNERDMIPILADSLGIIANDKDFLGHEIYIFGNDALGYMYVDIDSGNYKVENFFKTDVFKRIWKENIKAYQKGWFERDILSDTSRDYKFVTGQAAAMAGDLYNIVERQNQLSKNVPEGKIELAIFNKDGKWMNLTPVNNYAMLSSTGKHPERAIMFLNWLRQSQENYDMLMLGIEGKTYNLVGKEAKVPEGVNPVDRYNPTPWFTMHFPYLRTWTSDPEEYKNALDFWKGLRPETSPLASFAFSCENVKAESLAVQKLVEEIGRPLNTGIISSEAEYQNFLEELDRAGMEKILKDTQRQIDEHLRKR